MMNERISALRSQLMGEHAALLDRVDTKIDARVWTESRPNTAYNYVPDELKAKWQDVMQAGGSAGFNAYAGVLLTDFMQAFENSGVDSIYPQSVLSRFKHRFSEIINSLSDSRFTLYEGPGDRFLKDLGICSRRLVPVGGRVLEEGSRLPMSLLSRGGVEQAFCFARLLLELRGVGPMYAMHMLERERNEWDEKGFRACLLRSAEMVEAAPEVRGLYGTGWLYDPALHALSPKLAAIQAIPQAEGAVLMHYEADHSGRALKHSKERRAANLAGEYTPRSFFSVWPRSRILRFLQRVRSEG